MINDTIVAIYDTPVQAERAKHDLAAAGIPEASIALHVADRSAAERHIEQTPREQGFWATLFGTQPDHDTSTYEPGLANGSTVVSVRTSDGHVDTVIEILDSHHPVNIDERAAGLGNTLVEGVSSQGGFETAGYDTLHSDTDRMAAGYPADQTIATTTTPGRVTGDGSAAGLETMQLAEENLAIEKQQVARGGMRVRRYVVRTPVEQQVTLRDETVHVDRQKVTDDRPLADGGFDDKTIEMNEITEEVVVGKTARVVEEVTFRKQSSQRIETVRDTLRRDEIEIETIAAPNAPGRGSI